MSTTRLLGFLFTALFIFSIVGAQTTTTDAPPPPTTTSTTINPSATPASTGPTATSQTGTLGPDTTAATTQTNSTSTAVPAFTTTTTMAPETPLPPGATPAPTTAAPECEPSCRVNLYFSSLLQTPNNIQASLIAVAAAAGVGSVARVSFNSRHTVYSGIPYGDGGTLVTVTISSFPAGTCNNFTNARACLLLFNQSNVPTLASGLALVGVTNGTLIAADATIPTFGILASVSSLYLALYVGSGLGYLLFAVWSAYKFLVAYQLMMNERARDAAELIGLTLEELEQRKKDEEEAKNRKKASGGRKMAARTAAAMNPEVQVQQDPYGDAFASTDVDDPAKQSLELIVARMRHRSSHAFREQEFHREASMNREMVPQPSRAVLDAVAGATLPPVFVDPAALFHIQRGGLVEAMELPVASQPSATTKDAPPTGTFQRRQASAAPDPPTNSQPSSPPPTLVPYKEHEIDKLL